MTDIMRHDQVEQLLPSAALEILEGQELLQVTTHIKECGECARLLESYCETVASMGAGLPERPLEPARSELVRTRLLARAARSRFNSEKVAPRNRGIRAAIDQWAGWAVAAGLAGILLIHHSIHRPVAYGWLLAGVLVLVVVGLAVYLRLQRTRLEELRGRLERKMEKVAELQQTSGLDA